MAVSDHPRWFELSDGSRTCKATIYEAMKYNQKIEVIGGRSFARFQDGGGLLQSVWDRIRVTLSGQGGVPLGMSDLNFKANITLKCGAPRTIRRTTNSFPDIPPHRTDTGYAPYVVKQVEGFWVPLAEAGTATEYMLYYYPQITCIIQDPPPEDYAWDDTLPSSWTIVAEEI